MTMLLLLCFMFYLVLQAYQDLAQRKRDRRLIAAYPYLWLANSVYMRETGATEPVSRERLMELGYIPYTSVDDI